MNETKFVLVLGVISGISMLAWAGHGVVTGKIHAKGNNGRNDGRYAPYCLIVRAQQPVQLWLTCATYATVGIVILTFATLLLLRQGALAHS